MSDSLPRLLPDDPQNLLSVEARKRLQRAQLEAEKIEWEAEVFIADRHLSPRNPDAQLLRKEATFRKARAVMTAFRTEFSRIGLSEQRYREIMKEEIGAACNSLELSVAHRQLLEVEFFYPEEEPAQPQLSPLIEPPAAPKPETIGEQIRRLREECKLSEEELAEEVELDTRTVQRHEAGDMKPQPRRIRAYERAFSKFLKRNVVIQKTP